MTIRVGATLAGLSLCLFSTFVGAVDMADEYNKQIKSAEAVGALGFDIFGDKTNFYTGTTEFSITDVSLRGNSAIPVRVGRRIAVGDVLVNPTARPFGDWDLDIPYLQGVFSNAGWQSRSTSANTRCAVNGPTVVPPTATAQGINFSGDEYWSGNHLYVPGNGTQEMMNTLVGNQKPADTATYYWVTNNQWHFSCISMANGLGDAFLAIDPQGTRTTFNWMVSRQTQPLTKPSAAPMALSGTSTMSTSSTSSSTSTAPSSGGSPTPQVAGTPTLPRKEVRILPTRVEDRFGNYVVYTYDATNPWRLTKIKGFSAGGIADGREITLAYNAAGAISTVKSGSPIIPAEQRTWTYAYSNGYLISVTQPDASQWLYSFADITQVAPLATEEPITCEGLGQLTSSPSTFTATHPSGLQASFTFDGQRHGRSYVGRDCVYIAYPTVGYARYAPWYDVVALKSKTLSGPGIPTSTWIFNYGAMNASYSDECSAGCPTTKTVETTGPAGQYTRYTFGNRFFENEGKLLSTQRGTGPATILTTQSTTYLLNATNQIYKAQVGVSPYLKGDRSGERLNPAIGTATVQQGASFTWQVNQPTTPGLYAFDQFANPTDITRASTGLLGGPNMPTGYSRRELTSYEDNFTKWVLGQVKTVTCTGGADCTPAKEVSRTDYDVSTLLPWKTYSFSVLQQTLTYYPNGTLASIADGAGHATSIPLQSDWKLGVPQQINFPTGVNRKAFVNPTGTIGSITDEQNGKTCYSYDSADRLNLITYTSESATLTCDTSAWAATTRGFVKVAVAEYGIPAGHWKQTVQTGNGKATTFYDALWRPVLVLSEETGNAGSKSFLVTRYDSAGRATFTSYPVATLASVNDVLKGVTTSYDAIDRVTQTQQDAEASQPVLTSTTAYLSGFRVQMTNPRGKSTTTAFQAFDSPSTYAPVYLWLPQAVTTQIDRQPSLGKTTAVTRAGTFGGAPLSVTRSYVYDANERLCKTVNPESGASLVDYDSAGNIAWSADGSALTGLTCDRGSVLATDKSVRTYDDLNRVVAVDTPGNTAGVDTTYFADGAVHTLTAANPGSNNVTTTYTYNKRRLLTGESAVNGATLFTLGYGYNANGVVSTMTYPDGQVVATAPDALGRSTQVAASGGQVYASGIKYWPTGAISEFSYGNQIKRTMLPNVRQLPFQSREAYTAPNAVVTMFLSDDVAFDANGNVDYVTDNLPASSFSHTRDLGYDDLDRLIVADSPDAVWGHATYSYDAIDNLRTATIATTGGTTTRSHFFNYATNNQLLSISGPTGHGAYGFTYDSRGNTTFKNVGTTNCNTYPVLQCVGKVPQTFVYDAANRLSEVTGVQTYRYDGLGRRVQTTDADGKTTFWMYSQSGQVIYSSEARRSQNISYLYLGNTQVATRTVAWGTGTVTVRYQHTDALGTPVLETDASRNVTDRNVYSPWGEAWGTTTTDGTGYTGHVMDQGTGLTYMQQRYYDPGIGRFLSVDPAGAGFNAYNYANNNPYRFTDPDGRKANDSQPKPTTPNPDWPPDRPAGCGTTRTCWVGSDEKWHTTPVPSGGDFSSGVADGFSSLLKGNYRFARQTYRTVNFSNTEEFKKTRTESEVVDALVDLVANDKEVQKKIAAKIEDKIRNAPYDSPRFWGYILGRVGVGMLLAPLGASATAGDGLQLVEDGVRDPAALIIGAFEGRH